MFKKTSSAGTRSGIRSLLMLACATAAALLLAACEPGYNTRPGGYYGGQPNGYYGGQPNNGYYRGGNQCYQGCGTVREIREVSLGNGNNNNAAIGTVIGAVVGGLLGNQVGGGKGKTAATVAGAVGGGFAGHAIGERSGGNGGYGWQVVVQLQDGRYATVTQRNPPQVRIGDYVVIRNDQVYRY